MKIAIIVPSNNVDKVKTFLDSFYKMKDFNKHCTVFIISNNEFKLSKHNNVNIQNNTIIDHSLTKRNGKLIKFAYYRGIGIKQANKADYFLFLDDDNTFPKKCDKFFMNCIKFLKDNPQCSVLQAERNKPDHRKNKVEINKSGFVWTGTGLFIKNNFNIDKIPWKKFYGCCEETLFAYEALNQNGLPYIVYGNPTERDRTKPADWNQKYDINYSEGTIQNNIQCFIQIKYKDKKWKYYNNIPYNKFPKLLQEKINDRKK